MENASYGLSLCAETVAIATASAQGRLADVVAIGVVGGAIGANANDTPVRPCGRCRQVLNEAAQLGRRDLLIHCSGLTGDNVEDAPPFRPPPPCLRPGRFGTVNALSY